MKSLAWAVGCALALTVAAPTSGGSGTRSAPPSVVGVAAAAAPAATMAARDVTGVTGVAGVAGVVAELSLTELQVVSGEWPWSKVVKFIKKVAQKIWENRDFIWKVFTWIWEQVTKVSDTHPYTQVDLYAENQEVSESYGEDGVLLSSSYSTTGEVYQTSTYGSENGGGGM